MLDVLEVKSGKSDYGAFRGGIINITKRMLRGDRQARGLKGDQRGDLWMYLKKTQRTVIRE